VQVGEGVAGHPGPNRLVGLAKLPLGDGRDDVEVDPPERRDDRDAQQCRDDDSGSEPACADAEGDDRLAEGDDDDQAVTLCEVGRSPPDADSGQELLHYYKALWTELNR